MIKQIIIDRSAYTKAVDIAKDLLNFCNFDNIHL